MKKLMLAVAIVAAALGVKASTVSWQIMNVKNSSGSALAGGVAYVFFVAGSTADTSWATALEGKGASAVSTAVAGQTAAFKTSYTQGSTVAAGNYSWNTSTGHSLIPLDTAKLSGETKYAVYAVIFDTATITDASKFYVTAVGTGSTLADTVESNKNFSLNASSSSTAANWKNVGVPEPTSGLLMLVGASLLALRRRRA